MEFRILGPLYADTGAGRGPAEIRQPLLQAALAVLLLRANMDCSRSMLIEALWGSEPPGSPDAALRVCISRLRLCLGDGHGRLVTIGPLGGRASSHRLQRGYRMEVRPGELDVHEFRDLAEQGQAELESGNATAAAASLQQALELWGDPPLPDVPDSHAVAADVARLKAQRGAVADALLDAQLAMGKYDEVVGQLRAAVLDDPGRERSSGQLMRAYWALGLRNDALEIYQLARQAAHEEHGTEPGPRLTGLYSRILAEELAAEAPPRLSVTLPDLPRSQVPAPPPDFTGRTAEIARITSWLASDGLPIVVLSGVPGIGKSAMAAATALEMRDAFPDGQLYADLGGVDKPREAQDILSDILQSVGIPTRAIPAAEQARAALYRSLLADRKVLVVLDGAASAAQVRPLIPGGRGSAVLVTSRGHLSGLAAARTVELGGLGDADAMALLAAVAGPERFTAHPDATSAIVSACAGLPLALRLAGTVLASRPGLAVARLGHALHNGRALRLLAAGDVSVHGAMTTSYRAVPGPARLALSLASVTMPGEIPGWALSDLGGSKAVIGQLADAGLISRTDQEVGGARYRLHPLTRAYAGGQHQPASAVRAPALARLRAGWLSRADRAAACLPLLPFLVVLPGRSAAETAAASSAETVVDRIPGTRASSKLDAGAWLEVEESNISAVAAQACDDDCQCAVDLASRQVGFQCISGRLDTAAATWRRIADGAARGGDAVVAARATYYLARVLAENDDWVSEAGRLLAECLPVLDHALDAQTGGQGHALLAYCLTETGRHAAAIESAREAMDLAPNDHGVSCAARAVLGLALARAGTVAAGLAHCEQALRDARAFGEPAYEAHALLGLARALIIGDEAAAAAALCGEGIEVALGYGGEIMAARFAAVRDRAGESRFRAG